jgi:hypothetical protein
MHWDGILGCIGECAEPAVLAPALYEPVSIDRPPSVVVDKDEDGFGSPETVRALAAEDLLQDLDGILRAPEPPDQVLHALANALLDARLEVLVPRQRLARLAVLIFDLSDRVRGARCPREND